MWKMDHKGARETSWAIAKETRQAITAVCASVVASGKLRNVWILDVF